MPRCVKIFIVSVRQYNSLRNAEITSTISIVHESGSYRSILSFILSSLEKLKLNEITMKRSGQFPCVLYFHTEKNCFGYLCDGSNATGAGDATTTFSPPKQGLNASGVARVCSTQSKASLVLQLMSTTSKDSKYSVGILAVNGLFAHKAGLVNKEEVNVEFLDHISVCSEIHLEPISTDDWEIICENTSSIEVNFLSQLQIVQMGMVFPLWIENLCFFFRICSISPNHLEFGRVSPDSRVIVNPEISKSDPEEKPPQVKSPENPSILSRISKYFYPPDPSALLETFKRSHHLCRFLPADFSLRILPSEFYRNFSYPESSLWHHPCVGFALESDLFGDLGPVFKQKQKSLLECLVRIEKRISDSKEKQENEDKQNYEVDSTVINLAIIGKEKVGSEEDWVGFLRNILNKFDAHIILCENVRKLLCLQEMEKIHLFTLQRGEIRTLEAPKQIVVHSCGKTAPDQKSLISAAQELISQLASQILPVILPQSGVLCQAGSSGELLLTVPENTDQLYVLFPDVPPTIVASEEVVLLPEVPSLPLSVSCAFDSLPQLFSDCSDHLVSLVSRGANVLLLGQMGSGRSSIANYCAKQLYVDFAMYSEKIDCPTLKGKKVETVEKRLTAALSRCAKFDVSLLILDDLDELCGVASAVEQLNPGADLLSSKLAHAVCTLLNVWATKCSQLVVLALAKSKQSLNSLFTTARGHRSFDRILDIPALDGRARAQVLEKTATGSMESVAKQCDGFVLADLNRLAHRAKVAAAQIGKEMPGESEFTDALGNFQTLSQHNANVNQEKLSKSWLDVGGLKVVRKELTQALFWPTKYARLFSKCPVRLSRGILLYGPSGTGKTLIAGVVAHQCSLNFINVKGPELLSKYIGASEQSVRELFSRARNSTPCLIFFDEFDSLAPRRGHDSTGVTDRVVNQLLTELDGVEELEGVYVLAASSRPDLLDPALLRPGRIDRHLFCPLPNQSDRLEILQCISRSLPLDADVQLETFAAKTDGASGADLKALLCNAQIRALHRYKHSVSDMKLQNATAVDLKICIPDMDHALSELKVSVKPNVSFPNPNQTMSEGVGQRVSLA